jgi:hypothetical protein
MSEEFHLRGGLYIQSRRHGRSRRAEDVSTQWLAEITGGRTPAERIVHICTKGGVHTFELVNKDSIRGWGTCGWSEIFKLG